MRAERLISILMILQSRGRVTAGTLAQELEVSMRTIYRDLDALSAAGIPVYAGRGPGGGCFLLEEYRSGLMALTAEEVRSLFMLSIPEPLRALGLEPILQAAFRKLSGLLPAHLDRTATGERLIHLDWSGKVPSAPAPFLPVIYQALRLRRRLLIRYRLWNQLEVEYDADPYGLVARGGEWFLVCQARGRLRARPVAGLEDARLLEEPCQVPAGFDLAAAWRELAAGQAEGWDSFMVRLRARPVALPLLHRRFGELKPLAEPGGWSELELPFGSFEAARSYLLGLGASVEVLEPDPLRQSLCDFALQIGALYARKPEVD